MNEKRKQRAENSFNKKANRYYNFTLQCLYNNSKLSILSLTESLFDEYVNIVDAVFCWKFYDKI